MTTTSHELEVEGYLWGGGKGEYSYPICGKPPETLADAKRFACDFESLTSAKIVTRIVTTERTEKILR